MCVQDYTCLYICVCSVCIRVGDCVYSRRVCDAVSMSVPVCVCVHVYTTPMCVTACVHVSTGGCIQGMCLVVLAYLGMYVCPSVDTYVHTRTCMYIYINYIQTKQAPHYD